jgi:hypothetical protein
MTARAPAAIPSGAAGPIARVVGKGFIPHAGKLCSKTLQSLAGAVRSGNPDARPFETW